MSGAQMSWRASVSARKCLGAQVSRRSNVSARKCLGAQMSWRASVLALKCRRANVRRASVWRSNVLQPIYKIIAI